VRGHKRDIAAEHQAIADAAIARNANLACRLLERHFTVTADTISTALERSTR
jgi:DNA-binding GntR family transcriptional regulator